MRQHHQAHIVCLIVLSDAFLKDGTLTSYRENISVAGYPRKGNGRGPMPFPGRAVRRVAALSKSSTLTKNAMSGWPDRPQGGLARIGRLRVVVYMHLIRRSLASSGSNQAREGRLVDALAVRGDEGRDTLR